MAATKKAQLQNRLLNFKPKSEVSTLITKDEREKENKIVIQRFKTLLYLSRSLPGSLVSEAVVEQKLSVSF